MVRTILLRFARDGHVLRGIMVAALSVFAGLGHPALAQDTTAAMPMSTPVVTAAPTPVPANVPAAQSLGTALDPIRAEMLAKDLADLKTMLSGRWDNELQAFFEPELGVPATARHDRLHKIV